jgi:hypothetical protein
MSMTHGKQPGQAFSNSWTLFFFCFSSPHSRKRKPHTQGKDQNTPASPESERDLANSIPFLFLSNLAIILNEAV